VVKQFIISIFKI